MLEGIGKGFHGLLGRSVRHVKAMGVELDRGDIGKSHGSAECSQLQGEAPRASTDLENQPLIVHISHNDVVPRMA